MKREEAISIIKQIASIYRGTLAEHQKIQEAIEVITKDDKKDK